MEAKIDEIVGMRDERGLDFDIEVDGGIGLATVAGAVKAGANVLVAGTALFKDPGGLEHAVTELRAEAHAALG
jgi:ribulose-phosphate 3-epimerase